MQSISGLSWSCNGSILAVSYGEYKHSGWCDHRTARLCAWNITKRTFNPDKPDRIIELPVRSLCSLANWTTEVRSGGNLEWNCKLIFYYWPSHTTTNEYRHCCPYKTCTVPHINGKGSEIGIGRVDGVAGPRMRIFRVSSWPYLGWCCVRLILFAPIFCLFARENKQRIKINTRTPEPEYTYTHQSWYINAITNVLEQVLFDTHQRINMFSINTSK